MIRIFAVLLALLFGAGLGLEAQSRQGDQRGADAGPINMLLQLRGELGLTPQQVTRLEQIDAEMDRLNQPLVLQLSSIRSKIRALGPVEDMTPQKRAAFDAHVAEARPLMTRIQENNSVAMRSVGEVLTAEQRAQIAQRLRQMEENRSERNARFPRLPGRGN